MTTDWNNKKILLATSNPNKIQELQRILSDFPLEIVTPDDLELNLSVAETGSTYRDNARLKALAYGKASGLLALADDSGLEVVALEGEPGVHSARWAGIEGEGRHRANNGKLLQSLAGVSLEKRSARFVCAIVVADSEKSLIEVQGQCEGRIALAPRGEKGFGYDPLFEIPEYGKTFAELDQSVKNQISHRARALARLQEELKCQLYGS